MERRYRLAGQSRAQGVLRPRASIRVEAEYALAALFCLAGFVLAYTASQRAIHATGFGQDFWPSRGAAEALLHGRSVYADPLFVYPPTAAPAFLPTTLASAGTALHVWLYFEVAALILACYLATSRLAGRWWIMAGGLATAMLMKGDLVNDSLWLANPSMFLAPVAVGVLLCFEDERWVAGCGWLAATLLVKPLLIALLALPVLRYRWRALGLTLGPAAVLLVLALLLVPGAGRLGHVLGHLVSGSTLEGHTGIYYNLSLQALGKRLGLGGLFDGLRVAVACLTLLTAARWWRRPARTGDAAALGAVLMACVLLVGRLSESHYVVVLALCLLPGVVLKGEWRFLLAAAPAFVVMFVPRYYLGGALGTPADSQVRYILVELLVLAAGVWMVWGRSPAGSRHPAVSRIPPGYAFRAD